MKLIVIALSAGLLASPAALSRSEDMHLRTVAHRVERWPEGARRLEVTVVDGAYHGEFRTWYRSGMPYERRHFVHGHEEGVQQSWTEDGELYLNYEVRNGRRYGFINAKPCLPVEESSR